MKEIFLCTILFSFAFANGMEEKEQNEKSQTPSIFQERYAEAYKLMEEYVMKERERRKRYATIPSHLKGAQALIAQLSDELYKRYIPQLDGTNTQEIIETVDDYLKKLPEAVAKQVKNKFVELYANKLGFNILREIYDPETKENIAICFDQRCITSKQAGDIFVTKYPIPTSPWNNYSFEELLSVYNKQKKIAQFFVDKGKARGTLWSSQAENDDHGIEKLK